MQVNTTPSILIDTSVPEDLATWISDTTSKLGCKPASKGHFRAAAVGDNCAQPGCNHKLESTKGIEVCICVPFSLLSVILIIIRSGMYFIWEQSIVQS